MEWQPRLRALIEEADRPGALPGSSPDWGAIAQLLEPAIQRAGWSSDDVVAIGMPGQSVLAISSAGHVRAYQKGVFSKRVEVESVSYSNVSTIRACERGVRGRDGSFIEGRDARGRELFALGWSVGGGDPSYAEAQARRAAAERDRIFRVMQALI
jgi:hypothetical protein